MSRISLVLAMCVSLATVGQAGVLFYDVASDPAGWAAATAGMAQTTAYDFSLDATYPLASFNGPLTPAGAGSVSAGVLADGMVMDRVNFGGQADGLCTVGAGSYGLSSNGLVANYFVDAFIVSGFPGSPLAFEFRPMALLGGTSFEVLVNGSFSTTSAQYGHLGILLTEGTSLLSVRLYDSANGAEGVQGVGTLYYSGNNPVVPVPGALLLGTIGAGLAGWIRTRRAA